MLSACEVGGSSLTCLLSYIFRLPAIRVAIYPPLLNPEEDGTSLLLFVTPPPAESLGNQVGRLTLTFFFLALGALKPIRRCATDAAVIGIAIFWCVVWFHGTCGIQTSRRVSADYIWPELRRFPVEPPAFALS